MKDRFIDALWRMSDSYTGLTALLFLYVITLILVILLSTILFKVFGAALFFGAIALFSVGVFSWNFYKVGKE